MYSYETTWIGYLTKLDAIKGMVHLSKVYIICCCYFLSPDTHTRFSCISTDAAVATHNILK